MKLVLADQVAHGVGGGEKFEGQHPVRAVGAGQQVLRDDADERVRELEDDLAFPEMLMLLHSFS